MHHSIIQILQRFPNDFRMISLLENHHAYIFLRLIFRVQDESDGFKIIVTSNIQKPSSVKKSFKRGNE